MDSFSQVQIIICIIIILFVFCCKNMNTSKQEYEYFDFGDIPIIGGIFRSIGDGINNIKLFIYVIIGFMMLGMLLNFLSLFRGSKN